MSTSQIDDILSVSDGLADGHGGYVPGDDHVMQKLLTGYPPFDGYADHYVGMQDVAPPMLLGYISKLLPYVTHNIPDAKVMNLIMQVPKVVQYYSVKDILPYEGLYQELDGYLVPDIERTSKRLQETIYAKPAAVAETETET